jgi:CelD/BcsL family acetyltransferase involved in cellulose biosynthesis
MTSEATTSTTTELPNDKSALEFRVFSYPDFLSNHQVAWERLLRSCGGAPDMSPQWLDAIMHSQKTEPNAVRVIAAFRDTSLVLVWPFITRRDSWKKLRRIAVIPIYSVFCLHHSLLTSEPVDLMLHEILTILDSVEPYYTWMQFTRLTEGSGFAEAIKRIPHRRMRTELGLTPPYLPISTSWDEFLKSKSANFRSNLKRKAKKLETRGKVEHVYFTDKESLSSKLNLVRSIEETSWKAESGTAITSRKWEWDFYQRLVSQTGTGIEAVLTFLTLDGTPIAYDLSLLGHSTAYCMKTSYSASYADLSPGYVLRAALMQYIFDRGVKEYDFLGANERYKLEWSDETRQEFNISLYNRGGLQSEFVRTILRIISW